MELTEICKKVTGVDMEVGSEPKMRYADIPVYITNNNKIQSICDWKIQFTVEEMVMDVYNWLQEQMKG